MKHETTERIESVLNKEIKIETQAFGVFQLSEGVKENHYNRFTENILNGDNFELVHFGEDFWLESEHRNTLEELYMRFNRGLHPNNYYGTSVSVGDVIVMTPNGVEYEAWRCGDFGWRRDDTFITNKVLNRMERGLDIRKELALLEKELNKSGLEDRISYIKEEYTPIFEMADNRAILRLAEIIDQQIYDYDTYGYWDAIGHTEEERSAHRESLIKDIRNGDVEAYIDQFEEMQNDMDTNTANLYAKTISLLKTYKKNEPLKHIEKAHHDLVNIFSDFAYGAVNGIMKQNSEWGDWHGRIVDAGNPQYYIDIAIGGDGVREIQFKLAVVNGNDIKNLEVLSFEIDEHSEDNVRSGIRQTVNKADELFKELIKSLNTEENVVYKAYSEKEIGVGYLLSIHNEKLLNLGYDTLPSVSKWLKEATPREVFLHIKYQEPININGWKADKDIITFDSLEEMSKYINGEAAYDSLDNSVRKRDNEILMYAENERGEVVWGVKEEQEQNNDGDVRVKNPYNESNYLSSGRKPYKNTIMIDGTECYKIDEWQNGTVSYVLGQDTNFDMEWYMVKANETLEGFEGTYTQEYDRCPSRETVESSHADLLAAVAIDRYEEEYGADGRRAFPRLNEDPPEENKIKSSDMEYLEKVAADTYERVSKSRTDAGKIAYVEEIKESVKEKGFSTVLGELKDKQLIQQHEEVESKALKDIDNYVVDVFGGWQ